MEPTGTASERSGTVLRIFSIAVSAISVAGDLAGHSFGNLFLAANYYLWLGMGRVEGEQPLQKYIKYLLIVIALCFMVWATPRSIIATVSEVRAMGGSAHPALGFLGVMSAKNTAVNILILYVAAFR